MEGRTIFQMDKAAPSDQSILWHKLQRGMLSNLDCCLLILAGSNRQKEIEIGIFSLHIITDF